ncbi:MAG: methyltransferase domain-containing protein [Thermofilaceae archaeon]|nr:methyltransferase domain-containing protein [Thermofilaceae archaeon]MCX8180295.1 methyltransferase domain-containing protein [Thermofilaceae archaeon]MDW8003830.1 methyltransferase domain-containing protein [Thermofilaceae archaeon]
MDRALAELPYLPSPETVVRKALDIAELKDDETLVDLGCGDGRVLVIAARYYGAFAVGVELNPLLVKLAQRECRLAGVESRTEIVAADLFTFDVSPFDVIYVYPSPSITRRLEFKLQVECKQGCRVILHDHPLPSVEPLTVVSIPSGRMHVHELYFYVAGKSWKVRRERVLKVRRE